MRSGRFLHVFRKQEGFAETVPLYSVMQFIDVECESEQDAATAAEILEARIDSQIAGGAWYPANIEAWQNAEVIVNGNVVALIAMGDGQQQAVDAFNALFA